MEAPSTLPPRCFGILAIATKLGLKQPQINLLDTLDWMQLDKKARVSEFSIFVHTDVLPCPQYVAPPSSIDSKPFLSNYRPD
jgi:hypothetical protein